MVDPEKETLVILKPDCVQRQLCGELISRIERKGLKILKIKTCVLSPALVAEHYKEHADKFFYEKLCMHMCMGPVMVLLVGGDSVVNVMRAMTVKIREELCNVMGPENLIHASDSVDAAAREIDLHSM